MAAGVFALSGAEEVRDDAGGADGMRGRGRGSMRHGAHCKGAGGPPALPPARE
jgi:hypothetical protein